MADLPIVGTLGSLAGSVFGTIGHAVLGAFSWTIGLASKFILTTIAALVKMLIPHSWVHQGLAIMQWIVAVPDYAGKVTSPGGGTAYGFAGVNALRDTFMWLGIAIAPLTLVYATSRAMIGEGDPVGIPLLRMVAVSVVIVSYPYWWAQATALIDQITNSILTVPDVSQGLYKLMDYAVGGVALGGWQLIDLGLMGAIALELLGLIFLKVVLILLGALLYATGPVTIGLVPTRAGSSLARAWTSAVLALLGIGVAWATLFAVGALLIGDASSAGPLVAGNSAFASLAGGLLLAVAGLASLWLCLKAAKEAGSLLRMQLSGLLVFAGSHSSSGAGGASRGSTSGSSLRDYGSRLARAAKAANGELALGGAGGAALAGTARAAAHVGRRGLIGTAASGVRAGAGAVTGPAAAALGHTRAGAVASRMARAGTASWIATAPSAPPTPPHRQSESNSGAKVTAAKRRNGRQTPSTTPQPPQAEARGAASHSAKQPGGADQTARKTGPIGAGSDRSPTTRRANRARPAAAPPPPLSRGASDQRSTPNAGATPPTPERRSSSPPPPPTVPPSARKPPTGGRTQVDKPKQAPGKRPGRRWRANLKRGGR